MNCKNKIELNFELKSSFSVLTEGAKIIKKDSNVVWLEPLQPKPRLIIKDGNVVLMDTTLRIFLVPISGYNIKYGSFIIFNKNSHEFIHAEKSILEKKSFSFNTIKSDTIFSKNCPEDSLFTPNDLTITLINKANQSEKVDFSKYHTGAIDIRNIKKIHIELNGFYRLRYDGTIEYFREGVITYMDIEVKKSKGKIIFDSTP